MALAGAALAQDVTVDYDRTADFGAIKTFKLFKDFPPGSAKKK